MVKFFNDMLDDDWICVAIWCIVFIEILVWVSMI